MSAQWVHVHKALDYRADFSFPVCERACVCARAEVLPGFCKDSGCHQVPIIAILSGHTPASQNCRVVMVKI